MKNRGKYFRILIYVFTLFFFFKIVLAPPTPHVVRGSITDPGGSHVDSGTIVTIEDINSTDIQTTYTTGPSGATGTYVTVLVGEDGDTVVASSWNETNWGQSNRTLNPTVTVIDVKLNQTRYSEANVTISYPQDDDAFDAGEVLNVTATIQILGNDGVNCFAEIFFSQLDVFNLLAGESSTVSFGDINWLDSRLIKWNLTANQTGSTNITVDAWCGSDDKNLENLNSSTVHNITTIDLYAPNITIISPLNHSRVNNPVVFKFNVTDGSPIVNCSLYINEIYQEKIDDPQRGEILNFTRIIDTKYNLWYINCTEDTSERKIGTSGIYNLTINSIPYISLMDVEDPINLIAGSQKKILCNGTITDLDGGNDIDEVNATIYNIDLGEGPQSLDNNSKHYTNSSCTLSGPTGNEVGFNCTFDMEYYALNGTWQCNVTARDTINATNSSLLDTELNELLAIGTDVDTIDYGNLGRGEYSTTDSEVNVTNYGNVKLDVSLYGYAVFNQDNLSMDCDQGNISSTFERFDLNSDVTYNLMTELNGSQTANYVDFSLKQRTQYIPMSKKVYWKMGIPLTNAFGTCNGRVVFTAILNQ